MLCIEIDELTPCLKDNETGEFVETEIVRVKRRSFLRKFNVSTQWYVDWVLVVTFLPLLLSFRADMVLEVLFRALLLTSL